MKIIVADRTDPSGSSSIEQIRRWHRDLTGGPIIGLVPTMGALHEGHRSLLRQARQECDQVALTIFVNPTQFSPDEDLETYPRSLDQDLQVARQEGVDLVWVGDRDELYPAGFSTRIDVPMMAQQLCGISRPDFFAGVCLIVLKLFHIFEPERAYFGEKDYQQLKIIQQMTRDLDIPIDVRGCPLVRESDGLALSSRNLYLDDAARQRALTLSGTLFKARELWTQGLTHSAEVCQQALEQLDPAVELDYFEVIDREHLTPLEKIDPERGAVICMAALVDGVRLIDNIILETR